MAKYVMLGVCADCGDWSDFYHEESDQLELFTKSKVHWLSFCCNGKPIDGTLESIPLDDGDIEYDQVGA